MREQIGESWMVLKWKVAYDMTSEITLIMTLLFLSRFVIALNQSWIGSRHVNIPFIMVFESMMKGNHNYGSYGYMGTNSMNFDYKVDICADILLSLLVGASAVAFLLIYQGITMAPARRRRKKRSSSQDKTHIDLLDFVKLGKTLELRQYKNDSIQSKIIPTLKLPLFFAT